MPSYTTEYFVIERVAPTDPPTYHLRDLKGESISGAYYGRELVRFEPQPDDLYKVDIIRERGVGRRKQYFVTYFGWPEKFNEWISAEQLQDVARQ